MEKVIIYSERCEKCNSNQTRIRIKTNERVCYNCGHITKMKGGEENGIQKKEKG